MKLPPPTAKQQAAMQAAGQQIINLLAKSLIDEHKGDLTLIFMVLCSVTAHYLAGLKDDEDILEANFKQFGQALAEQVGLNIAAGTAANVTVVKLRDGEPSH